MKLPTVLAIILVVSLLAIVPWPTLGAIGCVIVLQLCVLTRGIGKARRRP